MALTNFTGSSEGLRLQRYPQFTHKHCTNVIPQRIVIKCGMLLEEAYIALLKVARRGILCKTSVTNILAICYVYLGPEEDSCQPTARSTRIHVLECPDPLDACRKFTPSGRISSKTLVVFLCFFFLFWNSTCH